jgi:hypothetical protein
LNDFVPRQNTQAVSGGVGHGGDDGQPIVAHRDADAEPTICSVTLTAIKVFPL